MLDHRWAHNPPTYQRTVTPNWYRTHTVPEFGLLGSWVTGACHYTRPKQHDTAECLICQIDYKLSDEATASKVLRKINSKLKLLYCQSTFLTHSFRRLLCNALIQPHFDLSTSLIVSSFKEKFKNQTTKAVLKNKCIRFYLNLPQKSWYISSLPFRKIMWLSVEHCITNTAFKCWNRLVFRRFLDLRGDLVSQMELYLPLRKTVTCQKRLSFLEPKIWSEINHIKRNL